MPSPRQTYQQFDCYSTQERFLSNLLAPDRLLPFTIAELLLDLIEPLLDSENRSKDFWLC